MAVSVILLLTLSQCDYQTFEYGVVLIAHRFIVAASAV